MTIYDNKGTVTKQQTLTYIISNGYSLQTKIIKLINKTNVSLQDLHHYIFKTILKRLYKDTQAFITNTGHCAFFCEIYTHMQLTVQIFTWSTLIGYYCTGWYLHALIIP